MVEYLNIVLKIILMLIALHIFMQLRLNLKRIDLKFQYIRHGERRAVENTSPTAKNRRLSFQDISVMRATAPPFSRLSVVTTKEIVRGWHVDPVCSTDGTYRQPSNTSTSTFGQRNPATYVISFKCVHDMLALKSETTIHMR